MTDLISELQQHSQSIRPHSTGSQTDGVFFEPGSEHPKVCSTSIKEQRLRKRALLGEGPCPGREPPLNPWVQTQYLWCRPTNLFGEEGSRYPRAQTNPQLRPTYAGSGSGPVRAASSAAPQAGNVRTPGSIERTRAEAPPASTTTT